MTLWNPRLGTLVIQKQDSETKHPLSGVEFKVTYADGRVVDNANGQLSSNGLYKTDTNGEITISGIAGTIVVTEEKTVAGYSINPDGRTQTVEVRNGETQTLVFYNDPLKVLSIQKYVTDSTTPIAGATFLITGSDGKTIGANNGNFVTDQNGRIVLENLTPGITITAKETKAAEGYALSGEPQSITIQKGEAQTLTFYNSPLQSLTIYKYEEGTTNPIKGVTFRLTDGAGTPIGGGNGEFTTDGEGKIVVNGLVPGTTVIAREIRTVRGYTLNGTPQTIQITAAGAAMASPAGTQAAAAYAGTGNALTFYDNPLSTLIVHKYVYGTKNEPLAGVTFKVTDSTGKVVGPNGGVYVTDETGTFVVNDLEQSR